jgi:hypothetical protein
VLWCAWTVAWIASEMSLLLVAGLWWGFDQVGIEPTGPVFDVASQLVSNLSLAAMQLLVLRLVVGISSPAAKAWVPVTVLVLTVEYFVLTYWLPVPPMQPGGGIQLIPAAADLVAAGLFGLAQGLMLAELLGSRSAAVIWTVGTTGIAALVVPLSVTGLAELVISSLNMFVAFVVLLVTSGVLYGGLTGAILVFLVGRAARTDQAPGGSVEPATTVR